MKLSSIIILTFSAFHTSKQNEQLLARVPRRSTTVISPATAKVERAEGSPVEGAAQRGRADVGRSALPLDSAVAVASALVGQARE